MNITTVRGDDINFLVTVTQDGVPVNITDWVFFLTLKTNINDIDNDAKIKKTITIHTNPSQGETTISVTHTETSGLSGNLCYDIQYKDQNNNIKTPIIGVITFIKDVTQRTS